MESSFFDMCDSVFNNSGEGVHRNCLCVLSGVDGSFCGFHDTCTIQSGNFNYLAAELTGKLRGVYLIAILLDDIHHVDSDNYRNSKLCKLCCEVKVTLKVCTVDDIEDNIGAFCDEVVSCDYFFKCVRGK